MEERAHAVGREQPLERRAGLVGAGHRQERELRAQRRGVARDVGRPAGALFAARDLDDGHRRLRRDALDVAEPVAVEHDVADDEHARTRRAVAELGEARLRGGLRHQRRPIEKYSRPAARTAAGS